MPCFHPLHGFESRSGAWVSSIGYDAEEFLTVPCGQCIGCRIDRSREWAIRIVHEASLQEENQFITLTYAPEHLPPSGSLQPQHFRDFLKRYRKAVSPLKIRFFHCGEYGERLSRPHYHAIIFGHRFDDLQPLRPGLYTSPSLEKLWGFGFVSIGDVTEKSAAYCARYVTKKINGDAAEKHYQTVSTSTGEVFNVRPEYVTMSLKPGIGHDWFQQYAEDCLNLGQVVHKGQKYTIPSYYDKLLRQADPDRYQTIKAKRKTQALAHAENNTPSRLAVREEVLRTRLKRLTREYEQS